MSESFHEATEVPARATKESYLFGYLAEYDCVASDDLLVKSLVNQSSYAGKQLTTKAAVPANIHKGKFRDFWLNELNPGEFVQDVILHGYSLPLREEPPESFEPNNASARQDMDFVRSEVKRLEALNCIERTSVKPKLVLPLSSVFSKKKRLVVDGSRCLNPYLRRRSVRLQDLRDVPELVKEGDFMCADDLDSGYWHVGINPAFYKYLGIHIPEEDGSVSFYFWKVLFLGISDAVFIFTTLLKPIIVFVHSLGYKASIYIDDIMSIASTLENALRCNKVVCDTLAKAGWIIKKEDKTGPSQRLLYLGLEICSVSMKFFIPRKKLDKIIVRIKAVVDAPHVKIREMASILGLLMSCYKALGPVTRIMTRTCYAWVHASLRSLGFWDYFAPFSSGCRKELIFWLENIESLNGFPFSASKSEEQFEIEIIGDASDKGLFAFSYGDCCETVARRRFTGKEAMESSTFREILVLHDVYCSPDIGKFSNKRIRHLTDNKAVEFIFKAGSNKFRIHRMVVDIFLSCRSHGISLNGSWRSRDDPLLQIADAGSKDFDGSSFSLDFDSFSVVLEAFSYVNLSVDAMAQFWNKKFPLYFSRRKDPAAMGHNFFAQKLSPDVGYYIFPPPHDIVAVLMHLRLYRASGVLILPMWPSNPFFNFVFPDGKHPGPWAVSLLKFRPSSFVCDPLVRSTTFKNKPSFDVVAIHFSFWNCEADCFSRALPIPSLCLNWGCYDCSFP